MLVLFLLFLLLLLLLLLFLLYTFEIHLSRSVRKYTFEYVRSARFRSACSFEQADQNIHLARFRYQRKFLHSDDEDSDHTVLMRF